MNLITKTLIATGLASMSVSPVLAAAAPTSAASARVTPAGVGDSELRGNRNNRKGNLSGILYAVVAIVVVVGVFFITRDDNDDDRPVSP